MFSISNLEDRTWFTLETGEQIKYPQNNAGFID
jgi:hypothetical protein